MGSGASTNPAEALATATPEELQKAFAELPAETREKVAAAMKQTAPSDGQAAKGLVDVSGLTKKSTNDDGLLPQPEDPKYRLGLVEIYVNSAPMGGRDKITNGHRFDSIPLANGMIKSGMSCQIVNYVHEEHDKFFEVMEHFDAIVVRCNPGQIDADGGDQNKFNASMLELSKKGKPVWPRPDVMTQLGAKDALCHIKHLPFGLEDTLGYYSPEEIEKGFPKTIAFKPRVIKQNRGSSGEGIWIVKLKSGEYCEKFGDRSCGMDEMLVLTEACDNHTEEHTVGEFIEWCVNGRTEKSGTWASTGVGHYFKGGVEAGGIMVDQRYLPGIQEGESRFFMVGTELYGIEHYEYIGGVGGETKTTVFPPDAPEYKETRTRLETDIPEYLKALGLGMDALPLLWVADFIPIKDHVSPYAVGEFNCSCLGISGFLNARGKDMDACTPEEREAGQKMCDFIGTKALELLVKGA